MTSVQTKKGATKEADRQTILKQMKVRTTFKKDKSWIHQSSEDENEDSPVSPQLKSLDGKKFLWSPTPETKSESPFRDSATYKSKEITTTRSSSSPVNKEFTSTTNEAHTSSSLSQSLSSENKAPRVSTGYIIRGQPISTSSSTKSSQPSFNGYKNSYVTQNKSASLPRVPTATGYKMSTEEYKKLAPFNTRSTSLADLSDDETPFSQDEHAKRSEVASGVLRNTATKQRSYVLSAAKRDSGIGTQDTANPFVAKRVEVKEEENDTRESQTLPKSLASYLYDDASRFENNWKVQQNSSSSSQTSPSRYNTARETNKTYSVDNVRNVTGRGSANNTSEIPKLASSTTTLVSDTTIKPVQGKITVIRDESDEEKVPKTTSESRSYSTRTTITRNDGVEIKKEENENPKSDALPKSLAAYLYEDANRFENSWKTQSSSSETSSPRHDTTTNETGRTYSTGSRTTTVTGRERSYASEIPNLTSSSTTRLTETTIKPIPGRITVINESDDDKGPTPTTESRSATTRTITTRDNGESNKPDYPKLSSWTTSSPEDTNNTVIRPGPGKITVLREGSDDVNTDLPKVTSENRTTTRRTVDTRNERNYGDSDRPILASYTDNESTIPEIRTVPGKITMLRDDSDDEDVSSRAAERRTTTSTETITGRNYTNKEPDLINWEDLDKPTAPENRNNPEMESPLTVISPEFTDKRRSNLPTRPGSINTVNEARYRVPEIFAELDSKPSTSRIISDSGNRTITTTTRETYYGSSRNSEPRSERRSSPLPRENVTTTVTEARYKVPEILDETILESNRSSSNSASTPSRTAEKYKDYLEEIESRSSRSVSSREHITTTTTVETRYESPSPSELSDSDPKETNNKILFVKEYVNSSENLTSPSYSGNRPYFNEGSESITYGSSSYLYGSAPTRSAEAPCTYCGREISDGAKIILEHLNIYCHEYCFKCGICHKPMGDLIDSLFIHRDVVHCESCYEKLF
ncbi:zinc finger protein 185 isoform X2 [Bombina bombina]|uniref:zinc finger protein 185 isoform X2 n=1 Tax=Bombina bombina TaxID=8345 RepID=UPI00235AC790|nr:zinc finger protein 185 isoform X2 [Bombina bombina]